MELRYIAKSTLLSIVLLSLCCMTFVSSVTVENFYPFGFTTGDSLLTNNDDGVSPPLYTHFPFYDIERTVLFVNNNGLLSFGTPTGEFKLIDFPNSPVSSDGESTLTIIAPFWADVDTTGQGNEKGNVWYRITNNTDDLKQAKEHVTKYSLLYPEVDAASFQPTVVIVVTWDQIGYFDANSEVTNTFQSVLISDSEVAFVLFLYAEDGIQWTTGDGISGGTNGLGGVPALVGFNSGDGIRSYSLPTSKTAEILNIDQDLGNTGEPGLWMFRVDKEMIDDGDCQTNGPLTLQPSHGSILGGTSVVVTGSCFDDLKSILCEFELSTKLVEGTVLDTRRVLCITPRLSQVGQTRMRLLMIDSQENITESQFVYYFSLPFSSSNQVKIENNSLALIGDSEVTLTWTPEEVLPLLELQVYNEVDITLHGLIEQNSVASVVELRRLSTSVPNTGSAVVYLPKTFHISGDFLPIIFQVSVNPGANNLSSLSNVIHLADGATPGIWTGLAYMSDSGPSRDRCVDWASNFTERQKEQLLIDALLPCPCNLDQAQAPNSGFMMQNESLYYLDFFNPGASSCFYQIGTVEFLSGRQCCYNEYGFLIDGPPSGGHSDVVSQELQHLTPYTTVLEHIKSDVFPFLDCCKSTESLCVKYYDYRPSAMSKCRHTPASIGFIFGDPHFATLDGFKYTFNGKGEFSMITTKDNSFTLQGRMTEAISMDNNPAAATVLSAIVAKQVESDAVQFEISRRGIDVIVDGVRLLVDESEEIRSTNVKLTRLNRDTYAVIFSCGIYLEVHQQLGYLAVTTVSLPDRFRGITSGLLGVFNGDISDDLLPNRYFINKNKPVVPLPTGSSLQQIHEGFGLTWILPNSSVSLFVYRSFENFQLFNSDPGRFPAEFEPSFLSQALRLQAVQVCGEDDLFCLFDIATTSRLDVGIVTHAATENCQKINELTLPVICEPPCVNGTCVATNVCNCKTGYKGERCDELVSQEECTTNVCLNGGKCRKLGQDSICICPSFSMGFNCENTIPFEFNCSSEINTNELTVQCTNNKPIANVICNICGNVINSCSIPITIDLGTLNISPGNRTLNITATDVTNQVTTSTMHILVEPLQLTCNGDVMNEQMLVNDCSANNVITAMECYLNGRQKENCSFPLSASLTKSPPGTYNLSISATDVFRLRDSYTLQYTKLPLKITLLNSSPRMDTGTVVADFRVSRPKGTVNIICYLTGQPSRNCNAGYVRYANLPPGVYILRIVAKAPDKCRDIVRRRVVIDSEDDNFCSVHLINEGITVSSGGVSVQFQGDGPVDYFTCQLDNEVPQRCRSPYRTSDLQLGNHRLQVVPVCWNKKPYRITLRFDNSLN